MLIRRAILSEKRELLQLKVMLARMVLNVDDSVALRCLCMCQPDTAIHRPSLTLFCVRYDESRPFQPERIIYCYGATSIEEEARLTHAQAQYPSCYRRDGQRLPLDELTALLRKEHAEKAAFTTTVLQYLAPGFPDAPLRGNPDFYRCELLSPFQAHLHCSEQIAHTQRPGELRVDQAFPAPPFWSQDLASWGIGSSTTIRLPDCVYDSTSTVRNIRGMGNGPLLDGFVLREPMSRFDDLLRWAEKRAASHGCVPPYLREGWVAASVAPPRHLSCQNLAVVEDESEDESGLPPLEGCHDAGSRACLINSDFPSDFPSDMPDMDD